MKKSIFLFLLTILTFYVNAEGDDEPSLVVDIYPDKELIDLFRANVHLQKVKQDDCQLTQDIQANAEILKQPLYQILWGEMLIHGVCTSADVVRGFNLLTDASKQGSDEAMYFLANYYLKGEYVPQDLNKAIKYLYNACGGSVQARMEIVEIYSQGFGNSSDYPHAYNILFNSKFDNPKDKAKADMLLNNLAKRLPDSVLKQAQEITN